MDVIALRQPDLVLVMTDQQRFDQIGSAFPSTRRDRCRRRRGMDLDDTLLYFTADHGDYAGQRGLNQKIPWIPFDDLARVPCFAAGGLDDGGRLDPELMQSFDFAVTCVDYIDVDVDLDVFDGVSLKSVLTDPRASMPDDRMVFSAISMKWPMARQGKHKYIRELGRGEEVLFDIEHDPGEIELRTG